MRMLANIEANGLFGLAIIVISVIAQLISTAKKHTAAAPSQHPPHTPPQEEAPPPLRGPDGTVPPTFEDFLREITGQKTAPVPPPPVPQHPRPPLRHRPERLPKLALKVVVPPPPPRPVEVAARTEPPAHDTTGHMTAYDAAHPRKNNMMTATFRRVFQHKRTARQAVLLAEILGQPYSLRQPRKTNY